MKEITKKKMIVFVLFSGEMRAFTKSNDESPLTFTWSLLIFLLLCNSLIGSILALTLSFWEVGLGVGLGLFGWEYGFLGKTIYQAHQE